MRPGFPQGGPRHQWHPRQQQPGSPYGPPRQIFSTGQQGASPFFMQQGPRSGPPTYSDRQKVFILVG